VNRRELINQHLSLVHAIVLGFLRRSIGRWCDQDEMTGWGMLGLCQAAARFEEGMGASFTTFAHRRIQGAIVDGIRLETGAGRRGVQREFASGLAVDRRAAEGTPLDELLMAEVREAIAVLPERERRMVEAVDLQGMGLTEAAATQGVSKVWGWKLRQRAHAVIRERLS
jgi:RNA polymerase sigma factor for flagellar operon FliA